jgi:signal transduction histidine kinase
VLGMLNGARELAPRIGPGQAYRVDHRALERWGLKPDRLPPETVVLFKTPGIWEQHSDYVLASVATIVLLSGFIVALLVQRRRRRVAESESAAQRLQLAHLMRVSVMGELSGAIAHEINQPLTAILSNAHAALDMVPPGTPAFAELRETLADIVEEDNRASAVINRLRNLLMKNARTSEVVRINDLVNSTAELLHAELVRRRITLKMELADALPPISGDPVQIQQVLLNLLMNSMDAMEATPQAQREITIGTRAAPTGMIDLLVRDCGVGIAASEEARVFEPFHTTKAHGLGLGLTICRTIATAHGGTLSLHNGRGRGAVAQLSLPAFAPQMRGA